MIVKAAICGLVALSAMALANRAIVKRAERLHAPIGKFIEVDHVRLHYTDHGSGRPVVLIHGNSVAGDDWNISGVAEKLSLMHRVIIFDRPGCGHSERPRGRIWTAERQADIIFRALQQLGIENPIVVGHSFGALVAIAYAIRHHAETAGLVLVSGYYFWTLRPDVITAVLGATPIIGDLWCNTLGPAWGWLNMPFFKRAIFSPATQTSQFEANYSPAMALRPSQIRASCVDGTLMLCTTIRLQKFYNKLMMPVTILAAGGDKIVFKKNSERLHSVIAGSALRIVKGAGHMLHHTAPEQVVAAVEETVFTLASQVL